MLLTTQQLEEADILAGQVVIIDRGQTVAEGSPDALKARLGADLVQVTVRPDQASTAAEAVGRLSAEPVRASTATGVVSMRVPHGPGTVPAVVRALEDAQVDISDVIVRRPSLDDVFLALTGAAKGGRS